MTNRSLDSAKEVFLVEGRAGDYEPSFWTVGAWTDRALAEAEAARLNEACLPFEAELRDFEEGHDDAMSDDDLGAYFDRRDAFIEKWKQRTGDPKMSTYEQSSYFVSAVPLRS